jgi:hypothetical protein
LRPSWPWRLCCLCCCTVSVPGAGDAGCHAMVSDDSLVNVVHALVCSRSAWSCCCWPQRRCWVPATAGATPWRRTSRMFWLYGGSKHLTIHFTTHTSLLDAVTKTRTREDSILCNIVYCSPYPTPRRLCTCSHRGSKSALMNHMI